MHMDLYTIDRDRLIIREIPRNRYSAKFYLKSRERGELSFTDAELEEAIIKGYVNDNREKQTIEQVDNPCLECWGYKICNIEEYCPSY